LLNGSSLVAWLKFSPLSLLWCATQRTVMACPSHPRPLSSTPNHPRPPADAEEFPLVDDSDTSTVDPARLVQVGRWRAAVCITADGTESFWLLSPTANAEHGCACPECAPHDQLDQRRTARQERL
jgi:hypothetical protein